jgi:hypothetical protein
MRGMMIDAFPLNKTQKSFQSICSMMGACTPPANSDTVPLGFTLVILMDRGTANSSENLVRAGRAM